jgi:hypothetical protein
MNAETRETTPTLTRTQILRNLENTQLTTKQIRFYCEQLAQLEGDPTATESYMTLVMLGGVENLVSYLATETKTA